ncbi:efflux RND transporter permease subunit [Glaciecola sp. XM2]|jgi:multidrug efflux pump subunit AcrB|uniref:efflux RND transporter permease subunit n=1 Tax=Glaciecola sp. XM2 TaxID=1914931 RepID=UPI001BDE5068|nr:efflux RND transporter permease subunit [Glaciecola sp. XM2]MBT1450117.1 efflux RND transporter permease subunit [Glaciecola sp. XM2]
MENTTHKNEAQTDDNAPLPSGIISYFAQNPVAANLLMGFIIIMGIISYSTIQKQMFPNIEINYINAYVTYPGASPKEIEESIIIKIEEALTDVTEIKKSVGRSFRGAGRVTMEIHTDVHLPDVLDKIKARIDGISNFPAGMEPITVSQIEWQQEVIEMTISGDMPLTELKPFAEQIEEELLQLSNVQLANANSPSAEIGIEIQPEMLKKYQLSINEITQAIRRYSANFSAGQIRTDSGMIAVRVENQSYNGDEFRNIPVKVGDSGAQVLLKDVATIKDEFTEGERYFRFNGQNTIMIGVSATRSQNIIPVADSVKAYIEEKNKTLPDGLHLDVLVDFTYYLNGRLDMMLNNLTQGAILVFLMLAIFLRFKLAFWVMIGLPVCFLGAMMLMPFVGITINILSLFAFIMVLGIVVDDAIVIGESAYTEIESKGEGVRNVIVGAKRVATPATFGVLTTIAVFAPFAFASGPMGDFFINIAGVAILCLIFSLIESKLILPAHIAHSTFKPLKETSWRHKFNRAYFGFINGPYKRFVTLCTRYRWIVFATFVGLLIISYGLIAANYVRMVPEPKVPHDFPSISIEMSETVADDVTINALKTIEQVVLEVDREIEAEFGTGMVRDILVWNNNRTNGRIMAPLIDEDLRPMDTFELARRWREKMPEISGMKSLTIQDDVNGGGDNGEFGYMLFGSDVATLNQAGRVLIEKLQLEKGVFDVSSTIDPDSKEVQLQLKPVAYDLGLDLSNIAAQVGASFYGGEAQRVLRDGEEVRVMVRYPQLTRERFADLKYALIRTPTGDEVMLGDVVDLYEAPGISYIRREGGFRSVYIWGSIDEEIIEPGDVVDNIKENILPELKQIFPSVKTELGGQIEEQQAQQSEQIMFFAAGMIMVYILLAVPLKSYAQPLIIMSVIPFSFTGAIWGHFLFDMDISMFSSFGLIAAAGVVINDSLVMTDFVNQRRAQGYSVRDAVIEAGCARFRAITLTSITTFAGVLPIMFETSLQAGFVIPMAVALGFAVMYATLVTLLLVPCLYMMLSDIGEFFSSIGKKVKGLFVKSSNTDVVTQDA